MPQDQFDRLGQTIAVLAETVDRRNQADPEHSYTALLIGSGVERCTRKFGEEAIELVIALMAGNREDVAAEAGDVVYHLLVALQAAGVGPQALTDVLESRRGRSGLADKADQ